MKKLLVSVALVCALALSASADGVIHQGGSPDPNPTPAPEPVATSSPAPADTDPVAALVLAVMDALGSML